MKLLRFRRTETSRPEWGIVDDGAVRPIVARHTVAEIFTAVKSGKIPTARPLRLDAVIMLPPTDENVHLYCAGLNYRDHAKELRMPVPKSPVFFTKSVGALCGARDDIVYPSGTRLLDYEVELALVVGRRIGQSDVLRPDTLKDFVLGLAVINDVSARDVQLSATQWFLGKSFRSFAPLGPWVQTLDEDVMQRLRDLRLELRVTAPDGTTYPNKCQSGSAADMIFPPHELLNCLREKFDLRPGDVIATGTPRGVAMSRPGRFKTRIAEILGIAPGKRVAAYIAGEIKNNRNYLERGDVVSARIATDNGFVDLGEQRTRVV
ncbi:MAG TPA: fumarylacetoacetate hydrolase family protein [Spirochaetota bacterium]|nr:fumarylacetoacetate hydrolase family protein [Spirochaetota bacterium]